MMNLVPFETPPLRSRQEIVRATTTTTTNPITGSKDASSRSSNCFDGHLDLSLGMSMSRSEAKASASHRSGNCGGDEVGCLSSSIATATPAIQLSAGHGRVGDLRAGAAWTSAFVESTAGFMHPWSLAARQQKAVAEKERRTPAAAYVQSEASAIPLPSTVGWPPVHTSRRNLITAMQTAINCDTTATVVHGLKDVTMPPADNNKSSVTSRDSTAVVETRTPPAANMFAKVYMDGYTIARKINLRAHGSYDSLSRVLTKMTRNFFCPADCSNVNTVEEDSCSRDKFIFLYEDFEGDRMLVGDVPWESMDGMNGTNALIGPVAEVVNPDFPASRFVKVFKHGEVIGRKIDLAPHNGYPSLFFTLKRLASNFSMSPSELSAMVHNNEEGYGAALDGNHLLIVYDIADGSRFFLGQVPWEDFMVSVKRIYIVPMQQLENVVDFEEGEGESPDVNDDDAPLNQDEAPADPAAAAGNADEVGTAAAAAAGGDGAADAAATAGGDGAVDAAGSAADDAVAKEE